VPNTTELIQYMVKPQFSYTKQSTQSWIKKYSADDDHEEVDISLEQVSDAIEFHLESH